LTDIVINPKDGAMYFATGGRKTTSGLYRVTYVGADSTTTFLGEAAGAEARAQRRKLESYYLHNDPKGIDVAWPYLGDPDRFLRWAARTVLEHRAPAMWQDRALKETQPQASLQALLAVVRKADKALQPRVLDALDRLDWTKLNEAQKQELLRVYSLAFIRMG